MSRGSLNDVFNPFRRKRFLLEDCENEAIAGAARLEPIKVLWVGAPAEANRLASKFGVDVAKTFD